MAKTGTSLGGEILIYVDGTAVAHSKSATLTASRAMISSVSKDTTADWMDKSPGTQEWSIDFGGLYVYAAAYGISDIFALQIAGTQVSLKFSPNTSGNKYFTGNAYFTGCTVDAPDQEYTTYSGTAEGDGALAEVTLT